MPSIQFIMRTYSAPFQTLEGVAKMQLDRDYLQKRGGFKSLCSMDQFIIQIVDNMKVSGMNLHHSLAKELVRRLTASIICSHGKAQAADPAQAKKFSAECFETMGDLDTGILQRSI